MSSSTIDIHGLIQSRTYDIYTFIKEHRLEIDDHLVTCKSCCKRLLKYVEQLPRFFARMVVNLPEPQSYHERMTQLEHLQGGQCLQCGCLVLDTAWTRDQARETFYRAFARIMEMSYEDAINLSELTRLLDLPLEVASLRQLRNAFWIPDGSLSTPEGRDLEEGDLVSQLPETIGQFISKLTSLHSGMSYVECSGHWTP